jgi:hypothetical protein
MSQHGRGVKAGNLNSELRKDDTPLPVNGTAAQLNTLAQRYTEGTTLSSILYNGYRVFLGGKAAGAWC